MGAGILAPVIPFVVRPHRTDGLTVGLLALAFSAAQFVSAPFLGAWSDRQGRRPVLLACLAGTAASYFLFGAAESLPVLFAARLLAGFAGGSVTTAQAYIADISDPRDRAKNFGLIGAAFGLGFILGPALGGALSRVSLSAPAYAAGALSLLTLGVAAATLHETLPQDRRANRAVQWRDLDPVSQICGALRRPALSGLILATIALNFAMAGLQTNFPVFTHARFGLDASGNALLFAFLGLMAALTQGYLLRRLAGRAGETSLAVAGSVLFALGFFVAAAASAVWMLYASLALSALGYGLAGPSLTGLISRRAGADEQGALLGTAQSASSLTRILGPVWAGAMFDHFGSGAPYWSGALFSLAAAGCVWRAALSAAGEGAPARPCLRDRPGS